MARERYGSLGALLAVLAVVSFIGSLLIPPPGRPAPGYEPALIVLLPDWGRVGLFYGSGVLLAAAITLWMLARRRASAR
jgi:hypothetical protein